MDRSSVSRVNERMLFVKIIGKCLTNVISICAPQVGRCVDEKDEFWDMAIILLAKKGHSRTWHNKLNHGQEGRNVKAIPGEEYGRTQKMRQTVSATWVRCFDDDGGVGRVVTILTSKAPSLKRPSVLSLRQKWHDLWKRDMGHGS